MIPSYNVERMEMVTAKQLREVGYTSEMNEFLAQNGVTKDEVTEAMESNYDENQSLETLLGEIIARRGHARTGATGAEAPERSSQA